MDLEMQELFPRVYVGGVYNAARIDAGDDGWLLIYVSERMIPALERPKHYFYEMPILKCDDDGTVFTTKARLDRVKSAIDVGLRSGCRVLVFCGAGSERSPLAIAWYIHRRTPLTVDDAYDWIQRIRSTVFRRTDWIRGYDITARRR